MASSDILAKLEEILERQANIEAKLDAMMEGQPEREQTTAAAPKRTRTPAVDRVPCTYKKKDGKPCEKPSRPNTEYCAEHPEGMTRAAYKKKMEGTTPSSDKKEPATPAKMAGPRLTFDKDESNNIQIIKTPAMFKNIVISIEQPYKAYFKRLSDSVAINLTDTEVKQLEKTNIVLAPEDEQNDMLEQLNLSLAKKIGVSTSKKIRVELSSSEDEDEVKVKPVAKAKVESKPNVKPEPKVEVNSDSEDEAEPKVEPKAEPKTESKAEPKMTTKSKVDSKAKKPKSDSESDSDSDDERSKRPVKGRKNITVSDDDSD